MTRQIDNPRNTPELPRNAFANLTRLSSRKTIARFVSIPRRDPHNVVLLDDPDTFPSPLNAE